jgi:hypothetical protein
MADFALTIAGDLDLTTNDLQILEGLDAIRQELQIRYRFFLSEWFLNEEEGVPYIQHILKKNATDAQVRLVLTEVAKTTPGVEEIRDYDADLDRANRVLTVSLEIGAIVDGELVYAPFVVEVRL